MNKIKTTALMISGLFLFPALAQGKEVRPEQAAAAMMRLQASLFSPVKVPKPADQGISLWSRLREDFRIGEVNSTLVRSHESKFAANQAYFNRTLNRSRPYMYHITNEVRKRNMPAEIALLPFIESAYVTKARSHAGASGLWQFMPATGRHYGLEQTPMYDGRHDVYAATNAALDYLQYLHGLFGDWSLALAAYNWGEGNVSRAVRRAQLAGLEPTYENLRMPAETRNYVPKLLAVRNLVNNPNAFGLKLPEIEHKPYFAAVSVDKPLDITAAASLANISEAEFLALNPAFKTPVFLPKNRRQMLLPVAAVKTFEKNYQKSDAASLLSWDVFTPQTRMDLSDIALSTGSTVADLKRLNGISGSHVGAGRTLLVNKNTALALNRSAEPAQIQLARADVDNVPDTYVEQAPVLGPNATPAAALAAAKPAAASDVVIQTAAATRPAAKPAPQTATLAFRQPETPPEAKPALNLAAADKTTAAPVAETFAAAAQSVSEPKPAVQTAAAQTQTTGGAEESADPLMDLVGNSQQRMQQMAADAVQRSLAESDAAEQRNLRRQQAQAKAREEANKAKAQAEQLAKAKNDRAPVQTAKAETPAKTTTHKVGSGDTLYSIAKNYGVDVADLVAANGIKGNNIRTGQVLKVVGGKGKVMASQTASGKKAAAVPASYTVRKGDTLENIASRYNLKVNDLRKLNNGGKALKAGQKIKLSPS